MFKRSSRKSQELSNVDAAWYSMEIPTNLMMVSGVLIFDSLLDSERLINLIENRMLVLDRFRQRVVPPIIPLAKPTWEIDPAFDINNHIIFENLPEPSGDAELSNLINHLISKPLDYDHPLWQFHVINNYGPGSAIITRLHHSIADGIALMYVLLSLTEEIPDAHKDIESQHPRPRHSQHRSRLLGIPGRYMQLARRLRDESLEMISHPGKVVDIAKLIRSAAAATAYLVLRTPDPPTIFKGSLVIEKRAAWSPPIPLEEIKRIGKILSGTVNDVLLAVMTGALRRYMLQRGMSIDPELNFRAVVPVNLRSMADAYKLGNQFGLVFLSLPVGIEDPYDRLIELKKRMDHLKDTPEAVVAFGILNAIGLSPSEIQDIVVGMFAEKATCVMTNVPGPKTDRYLAGAKINNIMFWVPQSGRLGLGVSIISYNDRVRLGIMTDAGLVPDPENITRAFSDEFAQLKEFARLVYMFDQENPESSLTTK